jgi:prophage regulatory protein
MAMQVKLTSSRVIRMSDARTKTGLCTSTIYDLISRGIFPKPFPLVPGGRAVGWLEADLDRWLTQRKYESKQSSSAPKSDPLERRLVDATAAVAEDLS